MSTTEISSEASSYSSNTSPEPDSRGIIRNPHKPDYVEESKESNGSSKAVSAVAGPAGLSHILSQYIPLGSLTVRLSTHSKQDFFGDDWNESQDLWAAFHDHLKPRDAGTIAFARTLVDNRWIRVYSRRHQQAKDFASLRIFVLPDDYGRRYVDRSNAYLRKVLVKLVNELDISLESWNGSNNPDGPSSHYSFESSNGDSLFYLFNTLPSPSSSPCPVSCPISEIAVQSVLGSVKLPGLQTRLYPYQKRTVATMISREVEPVRALDPRLTPMQGPTAQVFYYDNETGALLHDKREYDEARGGILGESMGLGKTLVCLATIVATKGHWPEIPPQHSIALDLVRPGVGSLMDMAAAAVGRSKIPWRAVFADLSRAGESHEKCLALLNKNVASYTIPPPVTRQSRHPLMVPKGRKIRLSTATLIIVPQNLVSQWKSEIKLHVEEDMLKVLCIETADDVSMPSANELLPYDIILMSRQRFERELAPTERVKLRRHPKWMAKGGCACSLDDDCHCSTGSEYHSPLREIHFLRIIMDEGHGFSSSGRQGAAYWALQTLHVDRRWVVSGTPANGLLGVEVGTAIHETSDINGKSLNATNGEVLKLRRKESALLQERKDLEKLGTIVAGFLQVRPWANSKDEDPASWQMYIMPYKDGRRKVRSLKTLLESLVVRHRIEDIEADIQMPPLHNRVVYIQPSWHDKVSINLFILSLTANAVTSERVGEDYMFHSRNRHQLHALITNLRQSGFYWTSFSPEDVAKTLKVSRAYYDEHGGLAADGREQDKTLIETIFSVGNLALESTAWRSFAELHEMGMFVEGFPEEAKNSWSLVPSHSGDMVLFGATQLAKAQQWVNSHLYQSNPSKRLADIGDFTMQKLRQDALRKAGGTAPEDPLLKQVMATKAPSQKKPSSTKSGFLKLTERQTLSRAKVGSRPEKSSKISNRLQSSDPKNTGETTRLKPILKSALKAPAAVEPVDLLPPDSPLARTKLIGTASAKLSYLLDRVSVLHHDEKILIFYEGDHIAWYIAQALDLLDIRYLIYTSTLSLARQNAYITTFNTTETFRVLLMNVHQAAHGLHIASASRVFFVNPVWQPNVEAQAIKRAHRIGQTRPVFVETLVLRGTLEEDMVKRRKGMTAQEHQRAERSLLDDEAMSTIIKHARFIPLDEEETRDARKQVARLEVPQQLFGLVGRGFEDMDDPDQDLILSTESPKKSGKRKVVVRHAHKATSPESPTPQPRKMSGSVTFASRVEIAVPESSNTVEGAIDDKPTPPRKIVSFASHDEHDASPPALPTRNVNFALDAPRSNDAGPTSSSSSCSSTTRMGFVHGSADEPPRSLFGGPSSVEGR